jgi:hypothetical protein
MRIENPTGVNRVKKHPLNPEWPLNPYQYAIDYLEGKRREVLKYAKDEDAMLRRSNRRHRDDVRMRLRFGIVMLRLVGNIPLDFSSTEPVVKVMSPADTRKIAMALVEANLYFIKEILKFNSDLEKLRAKKSKCGKRK